MALIRSASQVAAREPGKPLVSIVIPTYNYAAYVGRAIGSCLDQSYSNVEIIVVDDGSTDNTADVVEALVRRHPLSLRYVAQPNTGVSAARNKGMEHASGGFIAFLDSDDCLTPDAIETRLKVLIDNPDLGIVLTEKYNRYGNDEKLHYQPRVKSDMVSDRLYEDLLLKKISSAVTSILVRADIARRFSFPVQLKTGEDTVYLAKIFFSSKAYVLAKPTVIVNYHSDSLRHDSVENLHRRLALIETIFDDPEYSGALEPLRVPFALDEYFYIFKRAYKAGHYQMAEQYYRKAMSLGPPAGMVRLKPFLRFLGVKLMLLFGKGSA